MTSAYLTELRGQLRVTRDRLDEELKQVPPDYTKTANYERQIAHLLEEVKTCITIEGDLLLSCCSSFSKTSCLRSTPNSLMPICQCHLLLGINITAQCRLPQCMPSVCKLYTRAEECLAEKLQVHMM